MYGVHVYLRVRVRVLNKAARQKIDKVGIFHDSQPRPNNSHVDYMQPLILPPGRGLQLVYTTACL